MNLYFLRHASAGKSKANPAQDDKRPLDKEGIQQCSYIGRALAALDVQVDAIVSSPLKRAAQTASLVANEIGHEDNIEFSEALGTNADYDAFRDLLTKHATADSVIVVGHNPSLSRFLSLLITGGGNDRAVDLKKGAVALADYNGRKGATLEWCITPKIARATYDVAAKSSRPKTSRK